jgi:putative tryptophan/tyrosine transport system substrate-binding protein
MERREFITLIGGTAAAWPLAARAQQADRMRRVGVLLPIAKDDPDYQPWVGAFLKALQELRWIDGRNVRVDVHWATGDPAEIRRQAAELATLAPDVILAPGTGTVGPLMQVTHTVPIVFPIIADPVAGASPTVWRGRAVTPPASCFSNTASAENGWSCSSKSRPT